VTWKTLKVSARCAKCLFSRGVTQTLLATDNVEIQFKVINALLSLFQREFNEDSIPAVIGTARERLIRTISGNDDPYKKTKDTSNQVALQFESYLEKKIASINDAYERFRFCVLCAIVGNVIEFNILENEITLDTLGGKLEGLLDLVEEDLVIDDIKVFHDFLVPGMKILYLTDNAGEILFDKFLIRELRDRGIKVTVAVKGGPAMNDAMMGDAIKVGLHKLKNVKLITTENDVVGLIPEEMTINFKLNLEDADLLLMKGMAHFECLYKEKTLGKPIFYLFRTKCYTVATQLQVDIGKNVALFEPNGKSRN